MTKTEEMVAAARIGQVAVEQREAGCLHADEVRYDETYDGFYCPRCDIWLEPLCDDLECPFCTAIPLRPSQR
jgi:hypothetical protein